MAENILEDELKVNYISVLDREIIIVEILKFPVNDFNAMLDDMAKIFRSKKENSVLLLTVYPPNMFLPTDYKYFKEYLKGNAPFMRASAFYGLNKILIPLINAVVNMSGRKNIRGFLNEKDAMEWLLKQ
jgi:hypothetical protein